MKTASVQKRKSESALIANDRQAVIQKILVIQAILSLGIIIISLQTNLTIWLSVLALGTLFISFYLLLDCFLTPNGFLLYETLFNQTNDAIFLFDLAGNLMRANGRAVRMLGYTLEELQRLSFREIFDSRELWSSERTLETLLAAKSLAIYEQICRTKKGDKISVEVNAQIVTNAQNQALYIQSLAREICRGKQNDHVLLNTEKQLRSLVSALPDRVVILDAKGFYRDILNTASPNPDDSETHLIGKHVAEVNGFEFSAFCVSMLQKTLASNSPQVFEYEYRHANTLQFLDGRTIPYIDPKTDEKLVIWVTRDITEMKQASQALIDSEKRLRAFASALPDRAIILDSQGYYRDVLKEQHDNPSIKVSDVRGKRLQDLFSTDFVTFCLDKIQETLQANRPLAFDYEASFEGITRYLDGRTVPTTDPKTGEPCVIWISRDISARIQAEKQRLELRLEREKVDFLRQFAHSITHDLKTPLAVIGINLHLIERSKDAGKRQERMATIHKQLATLNHMIDEILAVARLDEMPQLQLVPTDFYEILHEVLDFLKPKAELKQIQLSLHLAEMASIILASSDELSRALSNLIDNAIKYTPNNGRVTISVYSEVSQLVFEVQDTGIGMSSEDMQRVFERFFRADRARKEALGTGLGLEITRRIIELHGGKINLESEVDRGTTFRVWLPLKIDKV
jgi:PAS domain S-box-containing protein